MYCNMHRLVLLLPLFATTNAESVCQFAGIYVDNTEIGQSNPSAGATLSITGDIFNFINFTDTFPNNSSKVAIIEHTNGWYELEYPTIGCGLAKINSGDALVGCLVNIAGGVSTSAKTGGLVSLTSGSGTATSSGLIKITYT